MPDFTASWELMALVALGAYLLGSVPFGIVMARAFGLGDLRKIGSGNIGATNVLRTGNKLAALLTVIFDAGKGGAAVALARWLTGQEDCAQIAGAFAFFGHCYPVYLRFRGGKGVATFLGTLLVVGWPVGIAACLTWLATAVITRYSSSAALMAAAMSTAWTLVLHRSELLLLTTVLCLLIFYRHRENIARLKAGTETKIGQKGSARDGG